MSLKVLVMKAIGSKLQTDYILIRGNPAGLFYGVQTLLQLLPPQIYKKQKDDDFELSIPAIRITDKPRFKWRGMHLDVARHFFSLEFIKKYIDLLALHKLNTLHVHLTDDQGWRLEIKKYPQLTEKGSWRKGTTSALLNKPDVLDGIPHGGYYTQEEIREMVRYAEERYITIVPEIEMPGHSQAALSVFPNLSCSGGPFDVKMNWGISDEIYCAGNEEAFTFLENVLSEVIDLFPSKYIHIGGDEVPKVRWENCIKCQNRIKSEGLKNGEELQSYFIQRIEKIVNLRGRQIIGWDEIIQGGLAPNASVMSWRGEAGAIEVSQKGHNAVMCPSPYCYFDYYQGDPAKEPKAMESVLPLEKVYSYEPIPSELTEREAEHILGAQGNVWTEHIKTTGQVEYMALPRMSAMAEVVWSAKSDRNIDDFLKRLAYHYFRLDALDVNYRWPRVEGFDDRNVFIDTISIQMKQGRPATEIYYTLDGTSPTIESFIYDESIIISKSSSLRVREIALNGKSSPVYQGEFIKQDLIQSSSKENLKPGLKYTYYVFEKPIDSTADLKKRTNFSTGYTDKFHFPFEDLPEYFGLTFRGFLNVPTDGVYTLFVDSNDGSRLYLDDQLVVENDGWHGPQERYGQIALQAGLHPIRLDYFQSGGRRSIKASIKGPDMPKHEIKMDELFVE